MCNSTNTCNSLVRVILTDFENCPSEPTPRRGNLDGQHDFWSRWVQRPTDILAELTEWLSEHDIAVHKRLRDECVPAKGLIVEIESRIEWPRWLGLFVGANMRTAYSAAHSPPFWNL